MEKQCISSSDSDTDSTVISNSDGSQYVENDSWILKKLLETKLAMETLSGELWSCIVLSLVQAIQRKNAEVKMEVLKRWKRQSHVNYSLVGFAFPSIDCL